MRTDPTRPLKSPQRKNLSHTRARRLYLQDKDYLYEGRFTPTINGKRVSKNIYAKTREECEEKLAELIKVTKAEIAEMKAKATA